jgi:hypothetical protein
MATIEITGVGDIIRNTVLRIPPGRKNVADKASLERRKVFRMPRFFYGNFDFEHRLADPGGESTGILKRLNAELATSWLAVAEEGDLVWTPSRIDPRFFREAVQSGLPRIVSVTSLDEVPKGIECVPWGYSADVRKLATKFGWKIHAPTDEVVRKANSRSTSEELERSWNVGLSGARRIETLDQFHESLQTRHADDRWVVKAMFSMSARERILGQGEPTNGDIHWIQRRIASHGAVFFEPWVDRVDEIGIQIDVPVSGEPQLIGVSPMLVDCRGQYAGSLFSSPEHQIPDRTNRWGDAIAIAFQAAEFLQSFGYFGPLGIDAMCYRNADGSIQFRPLQDINARWTMGRISLALRRLLQPNEQGLWLHVAAGELDRAVSFVATRSIMTSPAEVGTTPCRHISKILIGKKNESEFV